MKNCLLKKYTPTERFYAVLHERGYLDNLDNIPEDAEATIRYIVENGSVRNGEENCLDYIFYSETRRKLFISVFIEGKTVKEIASDIYPELSESYRYDKTRTLLYRTVSDIIHRCGYLVVNGVKAQKMLDEEYARFEKIKEEHERIEKEIFQKTRIKKGE